MPKIAPHLWYTKDADAAAKFYVSLFPNSKIDRITDSPGESPSGEAGSVRLVEFTLDGQPFMAMSAGPLDPFNHAISLMIMCKTQKEIDHYWYALVEGGEAESCGWVKDRYGVFWQVAPVQLTDMTASSDRAAAKRVSDAMMTMKKLDLAALEKAFKG